MKISSHPFGVLAFLHWNHEWNQYHFREEILETALAQLQKLDIGFVRVDILWSDLHRGFQSYDFSRYDHLISRIKIHGLNILAVLQYNKEDRKDGIEIWNTPPDSFEEFAAYVGAVVSRYKHQIHHWEIWNEPNLPIYWSGPKDNLTSYARLLALSYQAAKKSDPHCLILNGGLTEPIVEDLQNLYRQGAANFMDIVNIHTFLDPFDPKSPERFDGILGGVKHVMKEYKDGNKKIWITEMGCPGVPKEKESLAWFGGRAPSEALQAEWLEKQYKLLDVHPEIEKLFWAFYRDTENEFKDATDYLGLVRGDLTPKPAFERMEKLIKAYQKKNQTAT